jgi:solute carrier family 25 S-adenosylmethionine transporter 26
MINDVLKCVLAGGTTGVITDLLLFHVDTLKTQLQSRSSGKKAPTFSWLPKTSSYRGLASALLGGFPSAATFWTVYESCRKFLAPVGAPQFAIDGASAALSEICVCLVRNPFEVVKQQVQAGNYPSSRAALRGLVSPEGGGALGLYRGIFPTLLRDASFNALQYSFKSIIERRGSSSIINSKRDIAFDLTLWQNGLVGAISGGTAAAMTTPFDVVKTRLMTQGIQMKGSIDAQGNNVVVNYRGVVDAFVRIAREEGFLALFSGIRPRIVFCALGGSIWIGTYYELRRIIETL